MDLEVGPVRWDPADPMKVNPWGLPAQRRWYQEATPFAGVELNEPAVRPNPMTLERYLAGEDTGLDGGADEAIIPLRSRLRSRRALGVSTALAQEITVGAAATTSDAPIFIADKLGYFREEGLTVKVTNFRSAADMVPVLGTGALDAGAGSASAGLYNAYLQGINIKIVADKASSPPGYGATKILIRTDHFDSGRFKTHRRHQGLPLRDERTGREQHRDAQCAAQIGGSALFRRDHRQHAAARARRGARQQGGRRRRRRSSRPRRSRSVTSSRVLLKSDDEIIPNHQIAVLLYSEKFAKNRDAGNRFMRAYIRAVRFYNGALHEGRMAGPNADKVIEILAASTPIKDPAIYKLITPTGMNPDGRVNVASLSDDLAFYTEQKLVAGRSKMEQLVDHSFADAAIKALGPYKK